MIGTAANNYMLLVLSDKGKGMQSSSEQPLVCKSKHVKQLNIRSNMSKSRSSAFITASKHQETHESRTPKAGWFYRCDVLRICDEARSSSF